LDNWHDDLLSGASWLMSGILQEALSISWGVSQSLSAEQIAVEEIEKCREILLANLVISLRS